MRKIILIAAISGLAVGLFTPGIPGGMQDQAECTMTVQPGESIQATIDAAEEGAVICLAEGIWEENLVIQKALILRGASPEKSIINGLEYSKPVILIESGLEIQVIVTRLTIAEAWGGCADEPLGCAHGIEMGGKAKVTIRGNTISSNMVEGISIRDSVQATIEENAIAANKEIGITAAGSTQVTIKGNTISRNEYGGIWMKDSVRAILIGNTISENWGDGIHIRGSAHATIAGSTISENWGHGICIVDSAEAKLENNAFQENRGCGIYAASEATVTGTPHYLETNGAELCGNLSASLRIPLVPQSTETEIHFPGEYDTLQHAIDALAPGGTIAVAAGEYPGGLVIWKSLTLKGLAREGATLKGRTDKAPVISIMPVSKEVRVEGLAIEGGKEGLLVYGLASITTNAISRNGTGILMGGSAHATITGNTISRNWYDGIWIRDRVQVEIEENIISKSLWGSGIWTGDSAQASITGNSIWGNRCGMSILYFTETTISENTISENWDAGIWMSGSAQANITANTISRSKYGMYMDGSAQGTIIGNTISGNGTSISMWETTQSTIWENTISGNWYGIWMSDSAQATVEGNKIADNEGYGVALFQRPCFDTAREFEGAVRGGGNEMVGNKMGEVCPSAELDFLMTEEGGCYGPLCPVTPAPLEEQPTKGSPDAPVTMVEFAEFYCPYCARYFWETFPRIEEEYIDKGLVKYQFLNLIVHGPVASLAAVAGECAHEQGRFWQFHDQLFETIFPGRNLSQQRALDVDGLKGVAAQVGLVMESLSACIESYDEDYSSCLASYNQCTAGGGDRQRCSEEFDRCLSSNRMFAKILADREELDRLIAQLPAEEQAQAQRIGTPTFFINGHILVGAQPYERFKRMIEEELAKGP